MNPILAYLLTFTTAYAVNIPLGYWRENTAKFSGLWFLLIHASIPLLIYMRVHWHISPLSIPITITLAVFGQLAGSRLRRGRMTVSDREKLAQIPDLRLPKTAAASDCDVTVVLLNMGGPKTNADVKEFLHRIFLDPLILRFPLSKLLQPFFAWLIVTLRWKATAKRYEEIGGGSPIYPSTEAQVQALSDELKRRGRPIDVTYSFNYSEPLPDTVVKHLSADKKTHILPLSLYPHYSLATTGSNMKYLREAARAGYPELQFLSAGDYSLHPGYIQALADRVGEQLKEGESLDDFYLLFSAHGLPLYFLTEGDPYPFLIAQTAGAVLARLGRDKNWALSYQSAVGPLQWLKPSTDDIISALARRGIKKLLVVPVSFVTDHIETLCEIDIEYRRQAEGEGITDFRMTRAVESHPDFIRALADTVERALPAGDEDKHFPQLLVRREPS